jgi:hypothetical protein
VRVKLGSVRQSESANTGFGIGLDDDGHLIEASVIDWRWHSRP